MLTGFHRRCTDIKKKFEFTENMKYWMATFFLLSFFTFAYFNYDYSYYDSDLWFHAANLQELSFNLISPRNPQFLSDVTSERFTPYMLFLSVFKRLTKLDVFTTLSIAGLINFLLFSFGLFFFSKEYFQNGKQPFYTLLIMLFFWGTKGWNISGAYHIDVLRYSLGYPSFFAFALTLLALYFALKSLRVKHLLHYIMLPVILFVTFVTHPLIGSFSLLSVMLIILLEKDSTIFRKISLLGLIVVSFVASFWWPYFSLYELIFGVFSNPNVFYGQSLFSEFTAHAGVIVLVGVPIIFSLIWQRRHWFISIGFFLCGFFYIAAYVLHISMLGRYVFFMIFFLHLAIALKYRELDVLSVSTIKKLVFIRKPFSAKGFLFRSYLLRTLFLAILIVFVIAKGHRGIQQVWNNMNDGSGMLQEHYFLKKYVSRYEVVVADEKTSYVIPGFSGKVLGSFWPHVSAFVPDNIKRQRDVKKFFGLHTELEERVRLINDYNISYILWNSEMHKDKESLLQVLKGLGKVIYSKGRFVLIRIDRVSIEHITK